MKINLRLDTAQTKKQGHPLVLTIFVSSKDKSKSYTGYYSTPEMWDFDKEEPNKKHPLRIGIMDFILDKRMKINKIANLNKKLTSKQIYEKLYGKDDNYIAFWESYVIELKESGKEGNASFFENNLAQVKNFRKEIKFSDIDYNLLTEFKNLKRKTCSNGGINTYLRSMRTVYNQGIRRGAYTPETFLSPFTGIMEKASPTKDKNLTLGEMRLITSTENDHDYYDYFMLMFLLGGIDFVDLANIEKKHINNGRIKFERFKGGTHEVINNKIFPEAQGILDRYAGESNYLLPIHQYSYRKYRESFSKRFRKWAESIGVTSYFSSKSARYTFINIGKELEVNREVMKEIIGHSRRNGDMLGVYESGFPDFVRDEVHRKIIDAVLV